MKTLAGQQGMMILIFWPPFHYRQFPVRMNGAPWPTDSGTMLLARLVAAWRKSLVRAGRGVER
jgi:hypothetical protein